MRETGTPPVRPALLLIAAALLLFVPVSAQTEPEESSAESPTETTLF